MLCTVCTKTLDNPKDVLRDGDLREHHTRLKDLVRSVESKCHICGLLYHEAQNLGRKINWSDGSRPAKWLEGIKQLHYSESKARGLRFRCTHGAHSVRLQFQYKLTPEGVTLKTSIKNANSNSQDETACPSLDFEELMVLHFALSYDEDSVPYQNFIGLPEHAKPFITLASPSTASDECLRLAKSWINGCASFHGPCSSSQTESALPTRLIDVGETDFQPVKLISSSHLPPTTEYLALSHCWGTEDVYSFTNARESEFREAIPMTKLSQSFQDAVSYTRRLGKRYIWIDSLCICQDSLSDWSNEAMTMKEVYANAWCTLAISGFPDGHSGMFSRPSNKNRRDLSHVPTLQIAYKKVWNEEEKIHSFHLVDEKQWVRGVDTSPLNKRAWVLQERILSARTLHFGRDQMFWECSQNQASEVFPRGLPYFVELGSFNKRFFYSSSLGSSERWKRVVEAYSTAKLTRDTDKLVAIAGLARSMTNLRTFSKTSQPQPYRPEDTEERGDRYLAGLWTGNNLPVFLTWSSSSPSPRPKSYIAPSFSWAATTGPISWSAVSDLFDPISPECSTFNLTEFLDAYTSPLTADEYGAVRSGHIKASGPLRKGIIKDTMRETFSSQRKKYNVTFGNQVLDIELRPDACKASNTNLADLTLPPKDLPSNANEDNNTLDRLPAHTYTDHDSYDPKAMEIYLLPILILCPSEGANGIKGALIGLWVRPTDRTAGEYVRIGLFMVSKWVSNIAWISKELEGDAHDPYAVWLKFLSQVFPELEGERHGITEGEYVRKHSDGIVEVVIV